MPDNAPDKLSTTSLKSLADIWFVGDYGNGGAIAIHLQNSLSTTGFALQTGDKVKGTFAFEYTAHYTLTSPDTVPYEVHFKKGTGDT